MRKALTAILGLAAALLAGSAAQAQQTIKIGLIEPYSGQFADAATQQDNAIKLFMKQNGDTVAGKKIEIIRKDVGGINPPVAKRLAQELITRDQVDYWPASCSRPTPWPPATSRKKPRNSWWS